MTQKSTKSDTKKATKAVALAEDQITFENFDAFDKKPFADRLEAEENFYAAERAQQEAVFNDLGPLTDGLADAIRNSYDSTHAMMCQNKLLNHILAAIVRSNLNVDMARADYAPRWLELALQVQAQSMQTAKAIAAIEYMQTLTQATHANLHKHHPLPHPRDFGERNIKET